MNPDPDTLATRLYVTIDDLIIAHPEWAPERPAVGIAPKLTDAERCTLAVTTRLVSRMDRPSTTAAAFQTSKSIMVTNQDVTPDPMMGLMRSPVVATDQGIAENRDQVVNLRESSSDDESKVGGWWVVEHTTR